MDETATLATDPPRLSVGACLARVFELYERDALHLLLYSIGLWMLIDGIGFLLHGTTGVATGIAVTYMSGHIVLMVSDRFHRLDKDSRKALSSGISYGALIGTSIVTGLAIAVDSCWSSFREPDRGAVVTPPARDHA